MVVLGQALATKESVSIPEEASQVRHTVADMPLEEEHELAFNQVVQEQLGLARLQEDIVRQ